MTSPRPRRLVAISAGLSEPSSSRLLTDRLVAAAGEALAATGDEVESRVVELRDHAHEVVNHTLAGFSPAALRPVLDAVAESDGLIAVSPVFNASYSGLFKSFFDVVDDAALVDKPVLIGATGGTARHSLVLEHALRPMFAYLRAVVVPTGVYAAPEDWAGADAAGPLQQRIDRSGRELATQVHAREPATPPDPFALPASFEDLMRER